MHVWCILVLASSFHPHTHTHTQGSIYYNEKKLNVSKAIRKHGGQYVRPSQELSNIYLPPSPTAGNYIVGSDGLWQFIPAHHYNVSW